MLEEFGTVKRDHTLSSACPSLGLPPPSKQEEKGNVEKEQRQEEVSKFRGEEKEAS